MPPGATPFEAVIEAELGDYFVLILRRRVAKVTNFDELRRGMFLLQSSHVLNQADAMADVIWDRFSKLASFDEAVVLKQARQYLQDEQAGIEEEYRLANGGPGGGAPFFFREHFLSKLFDWVISHSGLVSYSKLKSDGWIELDSAKTASPKPIERGSANHPKQDPAQPSLHPFILRELRKRWPLSCGLAYRKLPSVRARYYGFVEKLLENDDVDSHFAYYMIRHSGLVVNKIARVDPVFRELIEKHADKLKPLLDVHKLAFSDQHIDDHFDDHDDDSRRHNEN